MGVPRSAVYHWIPIGWKTRRIRTGKQRKQIRASHIGFSALDDNPVKPNCEWWLPVTAGHCARTFSGRGRTNDLDRRRTSRRREAFRCVLALVPSYHCVTAASVTMSRSAVGVWAGFWVVLPSFRLRNPTQTNETIHWVVGDEGQSLIVIGDPAFGLERTLCKRRSTGRLLQESWSIDFQAFTASAWASASVDAPSTYEDAARHAATHFASSTCGRRGATRSRKTITLLQRRRVYWHCAGCFSRGYGKSKGWFALWNSGPRPERHGHESLYTGWGKVCRCYRFCVRVHRERSIHRKAFSGSVNLGVIDGINDMPSIPAGARSGLQTRIATTESHRCGVKVWPLETARNRGVTSANRRKSTSNTCPGKVICLWVSKYFSASSWHSSPDRYAIALLTAFGSPYHSTSEIRSTPHLSLRGRTS